MMRWLFAAAPAFEIGLRQKIRFLRRVTLLLYQDDVHRIVTRGESRRRRKAHAENDDGVREKRENYRHPEPIARADGRPLRERRHFFRRRSMAVIRSPAISRP